MAYDPNPSNLLNPVALWTDMGLRALDMTVSSAQSISEGVDRLTRASASVEPAEIAASSTAMADESASAASSGVALAADLQRSTFNMMTQGWLQWMSTLGSLASIAANLAGRGSGGQAGGRRRAGHVQGGWMEHATAAAEPKRRRSSGRAKPKSRRSRSA